LSVWNSSNQTQYQQKESGEKMAIQGLTSNVVAKFPNLGIWRKGTEKTETGGKQRMGKNLKDEWRFDPATPEIGAAILREYGEHPNNISVFFPYDSIEQNFPTWREAYTASGLKHRCDGQFVTRMLDTRSNQYFDPEPGAVPCPDADKDDKDKSCKATGRLMAIVPATGEFGYTVFLTHGKHDMVDMTGNLAAIQSFMTMNYGYRTLTGIRCTVQRVAKTISSPTSSGGRSNRVEYTLQVSPDLPWIISKFGAPSSMSLTGPIQNMLSAGNGANGILPNERLLSAGDLGDDGDYESVPLATEDGQIITELSEIHLATEASPKLSGFIAKANAYATESSTRITAEEYTELYNPIDAMTDGINTLGVLTVLAGQSISAANTPTQVFYDRLIVAPAEVIGSAIQELADLIDRL